MTPKTSFSTPPVLRDRSGHHDHQWEPWGGSMGGSMEQRNYRCSICRCRGATLLMGTTGMFIMLPPAADDARGYERKETNAHLTYFDRDVMAQWRARADQVKEARSALSEAAFRDWLNQVNLPEYTERGDLSEIHRKQWHAVLNELELAPGYRIPAGFENTPLPPEMPDDMVAFVAMHDGWARVHPGFTNGIKPPPDPIRVRHDEQFGWIFDQVSRATGLVLSPKIRPNQYWGSEYDHLEPWYKVHGWNVTGVEFLVGPRKRVISIEASAEEWTSIAAFDAVRRTVETLGKRDNVTWDTSSKKCLIHAWGKEKAVEYLTALIQAV